MKYVLLDLDYTEREDYRLNKEVDVSIIKSQERTDEFVNSIIGRLKDLPSDVICDISFELFVSKDDASELLKEDSNKKSLDVLDDLVYATCLIEGDPEYVDRGLENICERVVSLSKLYKEFEEKGYELPIVTIKDIENDILTGNMLKRENLLNRNARTRH